MTISGSKNAALGILAASIMTDEDVVIDNLPDVRDINCLLYTSHSSTTVRSTSLSRVRFLTS